MDRHSFQKRSAQDIGHMYQGHFPFLLGKVLLLCGVLQAVPIPNGPVRILYQSVPAYFFSFYKKKGKVGKDIVNIRSSPGNLDIHLLLIDPVTVPTSFWGNYGLKLGIAISLIGGKVDIPTLFDAFWQSFQNVNESI